MNDYKAPLEKLISEFKVESEANVSVVIRKGTNLFDYNATDVYLSASLIKLFIFGAVINEISNNKLDKNQAYTIRFDDFVGGSGIIKYTNSDISLTLKDMLYLMMAYSDNIATNAILRIVTIAKVQEFINVIGADSTKISVPMMPNKEVHGYVSNETCAADVALFYNCVLNGFSSPISQKCASACLEFLTRCTGSPIKKIKFFLSALNINLLCSVCVKNPKLLIKYLRASLFDDSSKRIALYIAANQIIASKSATGQSVFHDSAVFDNKTIIVVMTNSKNSDHMISKQFFSKIGKVRA